MVGAVTEHGVEEPGASDGESGGLDSEAVRRVFARPWDFLRGCRVMADLPPAEAVEAAFAGRSNVGKSSLINALTFQGHLARTSNTPGRTRELNFFTTGHPPLIVDMPGYGFAKAPKADAAEWQRLVFDYLRGRPNLARVYLLIDARHGVKPIDEAVMKTLDEAAVSYQVVLTKADKIKPPERVRRQAEVSERIGRRPAAYPEVLLTSAETGEGLAELRAAIVALDPNVAAAVRWRPHGEGGAGD